MALLPNKHVEEHDHPSMEYQDETDIVAISLQEQIELEEIALKALLDRRSQITHHSVSEVQKFHRLQAQRAVLRERKVTLQAAHTKHSSLRDELQESLTKSRDKLSKLEKMEAAEERNHNGDAPTTSSVDDTTTLELLDDDTFENDAFDEEISPRQDTNGSDGSEAAANVLRVPLLDPLALHDYHRQRSQDKVLEYNRTKRGFRSFLPMVDSKLVSKIMRIYQMETIILDRQTTSSSNEEDHLYDSSAASERIAQEATLRRSLLRNTCLDLLNFQSHTQSSSPVPSLTSDTDVAATVATTTATTALLDPNIPLCPYELAGVCADEHCPYQHTDPNRRQAAILPREVLPLPAFNLSNGPESTETTSTSKNVVMSLQPPTATPDVLLTQDSTSNSAPVEEANGEEPNAGGDDDDEEEEFITLPGMDEEMKDDEEDMDIADTDSSSDEDDEVVESCLQENQKKKPTTTCWWSNQGIDIFSSTLLPLEDALKALGGIKVIDSETRQLEISLPEDASSKVGMIAWLGRIVDCCQLATFAGRHDISLGILDESLLLVIDDSSLLHSVVGILRRIQLSSYQCDSLRCSNLQHMFAVQISFAILSQYVESLWESERNTSCPHPEETNESDAFAVVRKTVDLLLGNDQLDSSTNAYRIQDFESAFGQQGGRDHFQSLQAVALWSQCLRCVDAATFQSIPIAQLEDQLLKPVWAFVSTVLHKADVQSPEYLKGITLIGFVILSCFERFVNYVQNEEDSLGPSLTAALTSMDSTIHQILKHLGKQIPENAQLLSLASTPLVAASVASVSFLQQYSNAQNRLATVLVRNQLSRSKWMRYSDLLWSQMMHLRMSLPVASEMESDSNRKTVSEQGKCSSFTENEKLVGLMETLGVRLNYLALMGDSNLIDLWNCSDLEVELVSKASDAIRQSFLDPIIECGPRGPDSIDLNKVELRRGFDVGNANASQLMPSALPRSILLAKQCVELSLQKLPFDQFATFLWFELVNVIRLDVSHNSLDRLPTTVVSMTSLQELHLGHNLLKELPQLPDSNLRLLDVSHNRLSVFPTFLLLDTNKGKSMTNGIPKRKKMKLRVENVKTIPSFEKLEELSMTHNFLDPMVMIRSKLILHLKSLRSLEIDPQGMTDA